MLLWVILPLAFLQGAEGRSLVNLRGAGASFPSAVYEEWLSIYKAERISHILLNASYMPIGSGNGRKMIMDSPDSVEYAGSDSLLKDNNYKEFPDLQMYPVIAG